MSIIKPKNEYLKKVKLDRFLSREEVCSRSDAERLASEGLLFVNGIAVTDVEKRIDPMKDAVEIQGPKKEAPSFIVVLHKPRGIVSQVMKTPVRPANSLITNDSYAHYIKGKHKDTETVVKNKKRFYPLGSLEKESHGLLIMTNQKSLLKRLTQFEVYLEREFLIKLDKPLHRKLLDQLYKGVLMHGFLIKPLSISIEEGGFLRMTLHTDYKNQIFQILGKAGVKPLDVACVRVGKFVLGTLKPGQWLILENPKEVLSK